MGTLHARLAATFIPDTCFRGLSFTGIWQLNSSLSLGCCIRVRYWNQCKSDSGLSRGHLSTQSRSRILFYCKASLPWASASTLYLSLASMLPRSYVSKKCTSPFDIEAASGIWIGCRVFGIGDWKTFERLDHGLGG